MNASQRRAAVAQHEQAIAAINALFDKVDELAAARDRLTGVEPLGSDDDPIRDAELLLRSRHGLNEPLEQPRTAATTAAEHRRPSTRRTPLRRGNLTKCEECPAAG